VEQLRIGKRTFSPATIHNDSLSTASDFLMAFSSSRLSLVSSSLDLYRAEQVEPRQLLL
jgi:hypothetical protein